MTRKGPYPMNESDIRRLAAHRTRRLRNYLAALDRQMEAETTEEQP